MRKPEFHSCCAASAPPPRIKNSLSDPVAGADLPEHLIAIGHGWSAWREFVLRSAGFRARDILGFAAEPTSRAIDHLFELEVGVDRARGAAIHDCVQAMSTATDERRRTLRRVLERLRAGQVP